MSIFYGYADDPSINKILLHDKSCFTLKSGFTLEHTETSGHPLFHNLVTDRDFSVQNMSLTIDKDKTLPTDFKFIFQLVIFYSDGTESSHRSNLFTSINCDTINTRHMKYDSTRVIGNKTIVHKAKTVWTINIDHRKKAIGFVFEMRNDNTPTLVGNECIFNYSIQYNQF